MHSDVVVLFGATGDLARKKLFPALYRLQAAGRLPDAVVCVAATDLSVEGLRDRAAAAIHDGIGPGSVNVAVLAELTAKISLVSGRYEDPATFAELSRALTGRRNPLHYLAIPPSLFELVVESLGREGLHHGARVVVEKPFGRDLPTALDLNDTLYSVFSEGAVMRIDHFLGKQTIEELLVLRFANSFLEPVWTRNNVASVQVTMAESFGAAESGRGQFYDSVGAVRDVVQNHLMEVVALLAMEPPDSLTPESLAAEKAKVLRAIAPVDPADVVRGQYRRYRDEVGVAPDSTTETYAALRLNVENWRWDGVPFMVRTGKAMEHTVTEAVVTFKTPPRSLFGGMERNNAIRFRLGPVGSITLDMHRKDEDGLAASPVELTVAERHRARTSQDAYARLLRDAIVGERSRFANVDSVMEAWRIVDPILNLTDVAFYESGTWGPRRANGLVADQPDWVNPRP